MEKRTEKPILLGYWPGGRWKQARAVFGKNGISPSLMAAMGGKHQNNNIYILGEDDEEKTDQSKQ